MLNNSNEIEKNEVVNKLLQELLNERKNEFNLSSGKTKNRPF